MQILQIELAGKRKSYKKNRFPCKKTGQIEAARKVDEVRINRERYR